MAKAENVKADIIKDASIIFTPDPRIKEMFLTMKYQKNSGRLRFNFFTVFIGTRPSGNQAGRPFQKIPVLCAAKKIGCAQNGKPMRRKIQTDAQEMIIRCASDE